jgi:hypothetical protein
MTTSTNQAARNSSASGKETNAATQQLINENTQQLKLSKNVFNGV